MEHPIAKCNRSDNERLTQLVNKRSARGTLLCEAVISEQCLVYEADKAPTLLGLH